MRILILLMLCISGAAHAAKDPNLEKVLPFLTWKQQQIIRAQNEVVKLTNELLIAQSNQHKLVNRKPSEKVFNPDEAEQRQNRTQQRLKQSQQNLEIAKELEFDDYLEIYMQSLVEDPDGLKRWLGMLTEEEMVQAFQYLAKRSEKSISNATSLEARGVTEKLKVN